MAAPAARALGAHRRRPVGAVRQAPGAHRRPAAGVGGGRHRRLVRASVSASSWPPSAPVARRADATRHRPVTSVADRPRLAAAVRRLPGRWPRAGRRRSSAWLRVLAVGAGRLDQPIGRAAAILGVGLAIAGTALVRSEGVLAGLALGGRLRHGWPRSPPLAGRRRRRGGGARRAGGPHRRTAAHGAGPRWGVDRHRRQPASPTGAGSSAAGWGSDHRARRRLRRRHRRGPPAASPCLLAVGAAVVWRLRRDEPHWSGCWSPPPPSRPWPGCSPPTSLFPGCSRRCRCSPWPSCCSTSGERGSRPGPSSGPPSRASWPRWWRRSTRRVVLASGAAGTSPRAPDPRRLGDGRRRRGRAGHAGADTEGRPRVRHGRGPHDRRRCAQRRVPGEGRRQQDGDRGDRPRRRPRRRRHRLGGRRRRPIRVGRTCSTAVGG